MKCDKLFEKLISWYLFVNYTKYTPRKLHYIPKSTPLF